MDRKVLDKFKEVVLEKELKAVVDKGDINSSSVENLTKAACLIEKLEKIAMNDYSDDDEEYSSHRGYNIMPYDYDDRASYRRGRYSMDRMSGSRGYSRHNSKEMIHKLEGMLDEADSQVERQAILDVIERLENH